MARLVAQISLAAACVMALACGGKTPRATPSSEAEAAYFAALDLKESNLFPEAIGAFRELKTEYPYSRYAALADLGVADTHFAQHKYLEAIDAYRTFIRLHPSHEKIPYATLQIAESYYEQLPGTWFLLPPPEERDQDATVQAIRAYENVLAQFPEAETANKARERIAACQDRLAAHELYVARFYFKQKEHRAARRRAEKVLKNYTASALIPEALYIAGLSASREGEAEASRVWIDRLLTKHPGSKFARKAKKRLPSGPRP